MVFEAFKKPTGPSLDTMIGHVAEMLGHARHVFDLAMTSLLTGSESDLVSSDVYRTDRLINALEQEVRRELIVHTSVHGTSDITGVLIVLMVSRKVERIGDNAKNIHDLTTYGVDLSTGSDRAQLNAERIEISDMIGLAAEIFRSEDTDRAPAFLERSRQIQTEHDEIIRGLVRSDDTAAFGVPRALLYRYLKRIVANLEGVVAGVIQPLDLIDYSPDGSEGSET